MKVNLVMAAFIAASGSAFAQDSSDNFLNHPWISLESNHTDLAMAQQACQELDTDFHVPTEAHLNTLRSQFRQADLSGKADLLDVVALGFGEESRYRKYNSPDFLADYNGEARRASVRGYGTGVRIRAMHMVSENHTLISTEEPSNSSNSSDPVDTLFNDWFAKIEPSAPVFVAPTPSPIRNMCVQLTVSSPIAEPEIEGNSTGLEGLTRHEFTLEAVQDESNKMVEITIGKDHQVDCNSYGLDGRVEKVEPTGFDYPFYKLANYSLSHTLMGCPAESVRNEFLTIDNNELYIYDSGKPFVVYAPEDLKVSIKVKSIVR